MKNPLALLLSLLLVAAVPACNKKKSGGGSGGDDNKETPTDNGDSNPSTQPPISSSNQNTTPTFSATALYCQTQNNRFVIDVERALMQVQSNQETRDYALSERGRSVYAPLSQAFNLTYSGQESGYITVDNDGKTPFFTNRDFQARVYVYKLDVANENKDILGRIKLDCNPL